MRYFAINGRLLAAISLLLLSAGTSLAQERAAPRVIAPELIAPPPVNPSTLKRAAPRAPLSGLGRAAIREEPPDTRYFRPVAVAAGILQAEGRRITISGINIIPADQVCDAADGGTWPCGMRARTAFRSWLRGRAVDCLPPGEETDAKAPMKCNVAGNDVGAWLVDNGWALAAADGPYEDRATAAREARKGIFGDGVRKSLPRFETSPETPLLTLPPDLP